MFRRLVPLATVFAAAWAATAQAGPEFTTNFTVTSTVNTPGPIGSVWQVVGGQNGISYTTTPNGNVAGNPVYALSSDILSGYQQTNGASGTFTNANFDVVAVSAIKGTVNSGNPSGVFVGTFTQGTLQLYAIPKGTYNANNPSTWIGTPLGQFNVGGLDMTSPGVTPPGFPITVLPSQQNMAAANTNLANGGFPPTDFFLKLVGGPNLAVTTPENFDGIQLNGQEILKFPATNLPSNSTLDAVFNGIFGSSQNPFTSTGFDPNANLALGQTVQTVNFSAEPLNTPSVNTTGGVPEPASMLLWGIAAAGIGVTGAYRRRSQKK